MTPKIRVEASGEVYRRLYDSLPNAMNSEGFVVEFQFARRLNSRLDVVVEVCGWPLGSEWLQAALRQKILRAIQEVGGVNNGIFFRPFMQ